MRSTLPSLGAAAALLVFGAASARGGNPDSLLALELAQPTFIASGESVDLWIRAREPYTLEPRPGVEVTISWGLDGNDRKRLQRTTDAEGEISLSLDLPAESAGRTMEVTAEARDRDGVRRVEAETIVFDFGQALVSTDRRIYRPGQEIRARAYLREGSRRPRADARVALQILGPGGGLLARRAMKSSDHGIVAWTWELPATTPPGVYRLVAETEAREVHGITTFFVGDLRMPRCKLEARPERAWFLPGESARVEIEVRDLADRPIRRARVVVRRPFAMSEMVAQGVTDEEGRVSLDLDPLGVSDDLLESRSGRQFEDIEVLASVADPTTGETEELRFSLRYSAQSLHLYVVERGAVPGIADSLLLACFRPDGEPRACTIEISPQDDDSLESRVIETPPSGIVRWALPGEWVGANHSQIDLHLDARDGDGGTARRSVWVGVSERKLEIAAERTVLLPGQRLELTLHPRPGVSRALLQIRQSPLQGPLYQQTVEGLGAPRTIGVDLPGDLVGTFLVTAWPLDLDEPGFPAEVAGRYFHLVDREAPHLQLTLDRGSYRPGEKAKIHLGLHSRSAQDLDARVAVAVVDAAVEARAESFRELYPNGGSGLLAGWDDFAEAELAPSTLAALNELGSDAVPEDLDLLARYDLLSRWVGFEWTSERDDYFAAVRRRNRDYFEDLARPIRAALDRGSKSGSLAGIGDLDALTASLLERGVDLATLRDPWGSALDAQVSFEGLYAGLRLGSLGPDRRKGTRDDYRALYLAFRPEAFIEEKLECAVRRLAAVVVPRVDEGMLLSQLRSCGAGEEQLRRSFGEGFEVRSRLRGRVWELALVEAGREEESDAYWSHALWWDSFDWTLGRAALLRDRVRTALSKGQPLDDENAIRAALATLRADDATRDPWGRAGYWSVSKEQSYDDLRILNADTGEPARELVTVSRFVVKQMSSGPDGEPATGDDVQVFALPLAGVAETASGQLTRLPPEVPGREALSGRVADEGDAPLPGAQVLAFSDLATVPWVAYTDEDGRFSLGLPPGLYRVEVTLDGFSTSVFQSIRVQDGRVTRIEVALQAAIEDVITVTSEAPLLETHRPRQPAEHPPSHTPRVRREFRDTLLWMPDEALSSDGSLDVEIDLADNLTRWNVSALASTRDGRLATAGASFTVGRPLSIEARLPPALTEGDRLAVPLLVQSDDDERLSVRWQGEALRGGRVLDAGRGTLELEAKAVSRLALPVEVERAETLVIRAHVEGESRQDVSERTTKVRPRGLSSTLVTSRLVEDATPIDIEIPEEAGDGSVEVEVYVTENLATQLRVAQETLLALPVGCSEQVLSSALPSLLLLESGESFDAAATTRALEYLRMARTTLEARHRSSGGIGYWNGGAADPALTALAADFLGRASLFVEVDEEKLGADLLWLAGLQQEDGSFLTPSRFPRQADPRLTAFSSRVLATSDHGERSTNRDSVERALAWRKQQRGASDDPHEIADWLLALAAVDRGGEIPALRRRLEALATRERDGTLFWESRSNTPFHGWGRGGRIETTALALEALAVTRPGRLDELRPVVSFLIRERNASGAWASTRASAMALQALSKAFPGKVENVEDTLEVWLDGRRLTPSSTSDPRDLPGRHRFVTEPAWAVERGPHHVEIENLRGLGFARVVARFTRPWSQAGAFLADPTGELRLEVDCDRVSPLRIGDEISCTLAAERVGFRGHGMQIAELGLPPGVEVDRHPLEVQRATVPGFDGFEIHADHVLLYLWPRAGRREIEVRFRARLAMCALAAPSRLVDYYNPEAATTVEPARFEVISEGWQDPCGDGR